MRGGLRKLNKVEGEPKPVAKKVFGVYPKHELVSSHICRRSFTTNLYKINFPILSIMVKTEHKTQTPFLKYIQITPSEHDEKLMEFWTVYYQNTKEA